MPYAEFDVFAELPEDDTESDVAVLLSRLGWEEFLSLGDEYSDLRLNSYRRTVEGSAEYMLDVWDVNYGSPYVKVDTFPELMDLLSRWAPAFQAASVLSLLSDIRKYGLSADGAIETIAAKAAFGVEDGLTKLRTHERQQAESRRRYAEQRKAETAQKATRAD